MAVNSVVGVPETGSRVVRDASGIVTTRVYALQTGACGAVKQVEVSGDDGKTWTMAELDFNGYVEPRNLETAEGRRIVKWTWCFWKAKAEVDQIHIGCCFLRQDRPKGETHTRQ